MKTKIPECHGKPMTINNRVMRKSGKRIQFICRECGRTKTVKE